MLFRSPSLSGGVIAPPIKSGARVTDPSRDRVDHAVLVPSGGGVITLIFEVSVLAAVHFTASTVTADQAEPVSWMWLPALVAVWCALGSWRIPHRDIVNRVPCRGLCRLGCSLILTAALSYLVLDLVLGVTDASPASIQTYLVCLLATGLVGLFSLRAVAAVMGEKLQDLADRRHRVLLVGNNERARRILTRLRSDPSLNTEVVGLLDAAGENPARCIEVDAVEHVGALDEMESFLSEGRVDEVIVTLPLRSRYVDVERLLSACWDAGIPAHVPSDLFSMDAPAGRSAGERRGQTICYTRGSVSALRLSVKRLIDVLGAAFGLVLVGVPMLLIAAAIKLTSRGPVLFRQVRSGLHGRPFGCLKFRTMVVDAEARRKELDGFNEMSGPVFKMGDDPRVTRLGRFLRKYSLDELPQLFNVLVGDMSLVGPRPPIPDEVRSYSRSQLRRLSMRPGLTCIWQVSGRNAIQFEEWIRMDLQYIDSWSLALDASLIARTLPAVLAGSGK